MTDRIAACTEADLRALDDALASSGREQWHAFYEDRARPCPFFEVVPDASLVRWVHEGRLAPGPALDVGCGNGRNAIFLAQQGFAVRAIDYSRTAAAWAAEEVAKAGVPVTVECVSVFDVVLPPACHALVYDSGCFHHMAPHRRQQYIRRVAETLAPGGALGLTCFAPEGGSGLSDDDVYARGTLGGGLGYDEARLRALWSPYFRIESIERMRDLAPGSGVFGRDFLWALLAYRR